ncbi:MAG: SigE family RNA polymerase sigma factor [Williamsia herbipolensis]|nr:SigE family RNA polymerase sigma factor [Williamsia herbipolensis]
MQPGRRTATTFDDFVAERMPALLRTAVAITGDASVAEEVVQDVLVKIYRRWDRIATLDRRDAYVNRMLINEYVSWTRKWSRLVPRSEVEPRRRSPDPADVVTERDALTRALNTLPRKQRVVLALRYYDGLDDAAIADAMSCAGSTVRAYATRGMQTLRDLLEEDGTDD